MIMHGTDAKRFIALSLFLKRNARDPYSQVEYSYGNEEFYMYMSGRDWKRWRASDYYIATPAVIDREDWG